MAALVQSLAPKWCGLHSAGASACRALATSTRPLLGNASANAVVDDGTPSFPEWSPASRRTGVIALKKGMTQAWDVDGSFLPLTVLQVAENQVVQVKTQGKEGYTALQVGACDTDKAHRLTKPERGHLEAAGVGLKRALQEFKVTADAVLPVGCELTSAHFVPGQLVDVSATSKGKGFQGGIKRHNMQRQPKSHGNSLAHRALGGMGGCQDPGRVLPGKRMPGHMGGTKVTKLNLRVWKVEPRLNLIYVVGHVPGAKNAHVRITDAHRKKWLVPPPFPTYIPAVHGDPQPEILADPAAGKLMK